MTDEAKVAARLAFIGPYKAALARLDALILEASAASEAVYRIWRAADAMFVGEVSPRGVRHPDCGGLIRGNWPELALPGDLAMDGRPESRFSRWHRDIEEGTFVIEYGLPSPFFAAPPKPSEPVTAPRRFVPDVSKEPATPQVRFVANVDADDAEEARLGLGWNGAPR